MTNTVGRARADYRRVAYLDASDIPLAGGRERVPTTGTRTHEPALGYMSVLQDRDEMPTIIYGPTARPQSSTATSTAGAEEILRIGDRGVGGTSAALGKLVVYTAARLHGGCQGQVRAVGRAPPHPSCPQCERPEPEYKEANLMLKHVELDPTFALHEQYADTSDETTILVNIFDVDPEVQEEFKGAWVADAEFFKVQPGYISTQLHQGIEDSRMFLNYAVFENTAAFAATNQQPEFGPMRRVYPDGATAHPHLFRRVAVPGICVGEADGHVEGRNKEPKTGLKHVELDPTFALQEQYADTTGKTTILVNLFDVDPEDQHDFKAAWREDAEFFKAQPGYISAQLHQGIGESRMFLNYAVFENTAAFAATNEQPEFGPLRKVYPDSATAHPHLFRRLHIPGKCVGEADGRVGSH